MTRDAVGNEGERPLTGERVMGGGGGCSADVAFQFTGSKFKRALLSSENLIPVPIK